MIPNRVRETAAKPNRCLRCGRVVLDATVIGLATRVDPSPLSRAQQLEAIEAGVELHTAFIEDGEVWLAFRTATHIRGDGNRPALAEHKCGTVRRADLELLAYFTPPPVAFHEERLPF